MLEPPEGGGCVSTGCKVCGAAERGKQEGVTNSSQKCIFCRKRTLALGLQIQEPGLFSCTHIVSKPVIPQCLDILISNYCLSAVVGRSGG